MRVSTHIHSTQVKISTPTLITHSSYIIKKIFSKAAHTLNFIKLFTVSVICGYVKVHQRSTSSLHLAITALLYIVAKITGDRPLFPGAQHKSSSQRMLQAQSFDDDSTRHTQVSYIQSDYGMAEGKKEAVKHYRYHY